MKINLFQEGRRKMIGIEEGDVYVSFPAEGIARLQVDSLVGDGYVLVASYSAGTSQNVAQFATQKQARRAFHRVSALIFDRWRWWRRGGIAALVLVLMSVVRAPAAYEAPRAAPVPAPAASYSGGEFRPHVTMPAIKAPELSCAKQ